MILLRPNVPLKVDTTLEKGEKLGTLAHIILVAHLKSIQWFGQQINDSISIQPKHCTDMEKNLGHWIKESQTYRLTRTSPYNRQRM